MCQSPRAHSGSGPQEDAANAGKTTEVGRRRAVVDAAITEFSNWGRWGKNDRLGTLNLIDEEKRRRAAKVVRQGRTIGCGRTISPGQGRRHGTSMQHHMLSTGSESKPSGRQAATDWFGMDIHGLAFTHLDAPSHIFWNGVTYNGLLGSQVGVLRGDETGGVDVLGQGIVTRGVLLDIAGYRDRACDDPIRQAELEACESHQCSPVEPGDALVLRVGRDLGSPGSIAGLDPECLHYLHERDVALVCCDGATDPVDDRRDPDRLSVHTVGLVGMGLWLIDNADLEGLAAACSNQGNWTFLFVVAPLRLKHATGSPVNPIAVL